MNETCKADENYIARALGPEYQKHIEESSTGAYKTLNMPYEEAIQIISSELYQINFFLSCVIKKKSTIKSENSFLKLYDIDILIKALKDLKASIEKYFSSQEHKEKKGFLCIISNFMKCQQPEYTHTYDFRLTDIEKINNVLFGFLKPLIIIRDISPDKKNEGLLIISIEKYLMAIKYPGMKSYTRLAPLP